MKRSRVLCRDTHKRGGKGEHDRRSEHKDIKIAQSIDKKGGENEEKGKEMKERRLRVVDENIKKNCEHEDSDRLGCLLLHSFCVSNSI